MLKTSIPTTRFLKTTALLLLAAATTAHAQQTLPNTLAVDASEVTRGIIHIHLTIPAKPGPLTLAYPEWIPGNHRPSGPIANLVGLKLTAAGNPIPWKRDEVDMYAFHCDLPAGATVLDASFDFVSPPQAASVTVITWNQLLLYPKGPKSDDIPFTASLRLPDGWKFATALPVTGGTAVTGSPTRQSFTFKTVSLTTLIDSPVLAGKFFRTIPINPGQTPPHFLDMAGESESSLDMKPDLIPLYGNLVNEAGALFASRHYTNYHWLLTLANRVPGGGLEHHESSDDRVEENAWSTEGGRRRLAGLLAHEYIHSWCGKFRRPAGLATPDYQEPMKGELLWVYEGLTEYLASILCPRAGLLTPDEFHEHLAETAAGMDYTTGRAWRPLSDTTIGAPITYGSPTPWRAYRRSTDFYPEGVLLWLEIDTIIRQQTQGKKSLNDFCQKFFAGEGGGGNSAPALKPYTLDEVIATLNQAAPYDWQKFLNTRLNSTEPHAPLNGITNGGWKLIYTETPGDDIKYRETQQKFTNLTWSLGLLINNDDSLIRDIIPGLPADRAGIAPGMKLIAINGRKWTPELLKTAIKNSKTTKTPLELLVEDNELYKTFTLDYHDGPRYPHLERDPSKPDLLTDITKPLAPPKP